MRSLVFAQPFDSTKIVRRGQTMLVLLAALGMGVGSASAAVLNVGNCVHPGFQTIQGAVNAAQPGDTVSVCPGDYPEVVTITKKLTLVGKSPSGGVYPRVLFPPADPQCAGPLSSECPQIIVQNATASIQRLHIDGSGFLETCKTPIGIAFYSTSGAADYNDIRNEVSTCDAPFTVETPISVAHDGIGIEAETLIMAQPDFKVGVPIVPLFKIEATGNYIDNFGADGISTFDSAGNLTNNSIGEDYHRNNGIQLELAGGSSALNNTIWGTGPDDYQIGILAENSPKTALTRNTITNVERGIELGGVNNSTLNANALKDAFNGIVLICSSNNALVSNSVNDYSQIDFSAGVNLFDCDIDPGSDNNLFNGNKFNGLCAGVLTGTSDNTGNTYLNNVFTNIGPGSNMMSGNVCSPI